MAHAPTAPTPPAGSGSTALARAARPAHEISGDPARIDVARVHRWLSTDSYWASGRSLEAHRRAMADSLNFGAYDRVSGEQLGYARVATDLVTFGWICDVYVDRAARGAGLGTALMAAVMAELASTPVPRVMLSTRDAHGLYEKFGFTRVEAADKLMTRTLVPDAGA